MPIVLSTTPFSFMYLNTRAHELMKSGGTFHELAIHIFVLDNLNLTEKFVDFAGPIPKGRQSK